MLLPLAVKLHTHICVSHFVRKQKEILSTIFRAIPGTDTLYISEPPRNLGILLIIATGNRSARSGKMAIASHQSPGPKDSIIKHLEGCESVCLNNPKLWN